MMQRYYPRILIAAMVLVALSSGALYYLDVRTGTVVSRSRASIGRTYTLERSFQSLVSILDQAESGQRGFLLTDDSHYLETYHGAHDRARQEIEHLRQLIGDHSPHEARVDELETLSAHKLAELDESIARISEGRRAEVLEAMEDGAGDALMAQIREQVAQARTEELSMLRSRQSAFDEAVARRRWLRRSLLITALGVTLSALFLVLRIQRLQSFATMCAWSRTIQLGGDWVSFEEYLARRFGIRVSHGIAPEELDKLMSQIDREAEQRGSRKPRAGEAA